MFEAALFGLKWHDPATYVLFGSLFLAVVLGTWAGAVAAGKGRSMQNWFIIGFLLPFAGLIAAYIVKPLEREKKPADRSGK